MNRWTGARLLVERSGSTSATCLRAPSRVSVLRSLLLRPRRSVQARPCFSTVLPVCVPERSPSPVGVRWCSGRGKTVWRLSRTLLMLQSPSRGRGSHWNPVTD